jgi:hypothetical protein
MADACLKSNPGELRTAISQEGSRIPVDERPNLYGVIVANGRLDFYPCNPEIDPHFPHNFAIAADSKLFSVDRVVKRNTNGQTSWQKDQIKKSTAEDGFCIDYEPYRRLAAIRLQRMSEHLFGLFQEVANSLSARHRTLWTTDGNFRPRSTELEDFIQGILNTRAFS